MRTLSRFVFLLIVAVAAMEAAQAPMYSQFYPSTARIESTPDPKKIAIIGGGIAGSSAAYRLHDKYQHLLNFDIDVYETAFQAGGRINSTLVADGANGYTGLVETGAQVFSADDVCIQSAIDEVGLRRKIIKPWSLRRNAGVWNGQQFILRRHWDLKSRTWLEFAGDTWRYGKSPRQLRRLLEDKLPRFRKFYGEHSYPNPNLLDAIQWLDLTAESEQSAQDYLIEHGISVEYLHEIIQPTIRALYAHNSGDLNGLAALLAMNPSAIYQIHSRPRGNSELVYRLLRLSEAQIRLNSRVTKIGKSAQGKYIVTALVRNVLQDGTSDLPAVEEEDEYDAVIIATHLQGAGIRINFPLVQNHSAPNPFVERHVTFIVLPIANTLSPRYFNLTSATAIPDMIFTTQESKYGPGPEIFSIERSRVAAGMQGCVGKEDNLYKIISAGPIPDSVIAEMFGEAPETPLDAMDIRWIHNQVWPFASPSRRGGAWLNNNIELANGLFHTGIGEDLVSSMEMSCKMGGLVADMIFEKFYRNHDSISGRNW